MTLEEQGAHMRLLLCAWRSPTCELPADEKRIATMLGVSAGKWAKLKPAILPLWTRTESGWHHDQLTKSRQFVEEKREKNTAAANARWNDKPLKNNDTGNADAHAGAMPLNLNPNTEKKKESIPPTMVPEPARANEADFEKVCEAGGAPRSDSNRLILAGWLEGWDDFDLDKDILHPIARAVNERPGERTTSLGRFDSFIRSSRATAKARGVPALNCADDEFGGYRNPLARAAFEDTQRRAAEWCNVGDGADAYRQKLPPDVREICEIRLEDGQLLHLVRTPFAADQLTGQHSAYLKLAAHVTGFDPRSIVILQTGRQPATVR